MTFEFDPDKSASNKLKHGVDFVEAQELWKVHAVVVPSDRKSEVRYARVARYTDGNLWTAICSHRGQNIRIISVRRASRSDRELYEKTVS